MQVVKNIFKRLFRVYGHIFHAHFEKIVALGAEAHVNTCFRHYILFVKEFNLIEEKELAPLADKISALLAK
jgi:MOB kinase activator 1